VVAIVKDRVMVGVSFNRSGMMLIGDFIRIVYKIELIVSSAQSPDDLSSVMIDLRDFIQMAA